MAIRCRRVDCHRHRWCRCRCCCRCYCCRADYGEQGNDGDDRWMKWWEVEDGANGADDDDGVALLTNSCLSMWWWPMVAGRRYHKVLSCDMEAYRRHRRWRSSNWCRRCCWQCRRCQAVTMTADDDHKSLRSRCQLRRRRHRRTTRSRAAAVRAVDWNAAITCCCTSAVQKRCGWCC